MLKNKGLDKTFTSSYTTGQTFKISEVGGVIDRDLIIRFIKSQTLYTVNFPEFTGTKCDMLIVENAKYRYLTDFSLNGMYDITVSNIHTSSITYNAVTYDYNLTNLPGTYNAITGSSVTYTLPKVVIRYKATKTGGYSC